MNTNELNKAVGGKAQTRLDRRGFLGKAGVFGLGAATVGFAGLGAAKPAYAAAGADQDSVRQILTALLIAEDLATTFYYNVLVGKVIQDRFLAGPGGTALNPSAGGTGGNVKYMRSAFFEEWSHANLIRGLLGGSNPSQDPSQTFYFPAGTFDTLLNFANTLATLENAFIGAYLNAIQEFATKAAYGGAKGGRMWMWTGLPTPRSNWFTRRRRPRAFWVWNRSTEFLAG